MDPQHLALAIAFLAGAFAASLIFVWALRAEQDGK